MKRKEKVCWKRGMKRDTIIICTARKGEEIILITRDRTRGRERQGDLVGGRRERGVRVIIMTISEDKFGKAN